MRLLFIDRYLTRKIKCRQRSPKCSSAEMALLLIASFKKRQSQLSLLKTTTSGLKFN